MENLKIKIQLAVDLYRSGDFEKAEGICNQLISENPKNVFLYNLLGLILVGEDKIDEALNCYKKGINLDPNHAMIYNNIALLYTNNKFDNKKAEYFYNKSISANPKNPEAYNNLGTLYKSMDKFEEAINSFKKAIEANSKLVQAYHNLGNIYITIGKFSEAKKILHEAITIDPYYTNSHRSLSRLIKYNKADIHFQKLKKIYKEKNIKTVDKINIAFALGKAYEDMNDYKNSFKMYQEANSIYDQKTGYLVERDQKRFKNIKNIFHKNLFEKFKNCGFNDPSPIFILGMPRSGTTLVEQILSSHPEVFGAGEQIIIVKLLEKNFGKKNLSLFFEDDKNFKKDLFESIGKEYVSTIKNISGDSKRFTDKLPENFFWIGLIKLILPNAKILHCIRDPRDTCFSLFKNFFPNSSIDYSYDLNKIVQYYNLYFDLMNYWKNLFPNFIFDVKYENLIQNTEHEIRSTLNFCNLEWNNNCLDYYKNKRAVKTASDVQARNKIYNSSVYLWRKYENFLKEYFDKLPN